MTAHNKEIKQLSIASLAVLMISLVFAKDWFVSEGNRFIHEFYQSHNMTSNGTIELLQITPANYSMVDNIPEDLDAHIHFNPHVNETSVDYPPQGFNSSNMTSNYSSQHHNIRGGPNEHAGHHHPKHNKTHADSHSLHSVNHNFHNESNKYHSEPSKYQTYPLNPKMQDMLDLMNNMSE